MVEKLKRSWQKRRSVMVRAEWQHLFKNKILLLSVVVISFIPIMYSGFFLGSIWDPYGRTSSLPVAFVNEDKGAELNGAKLNVGQSVEQKLRDNHDLGWEFVNKKQADDGVADGHFYAVVRIPADFSEKASSITSQKPQQAVINYTTTPAKNYIGSLVSNQAAEKVKTSVSEQIMVAYAKGMLENLGKLGDGMSEAADGVSQLQSGLTTVQTGALQYTSGVGQIASNQQVLTDGLARLNSGSQQLRAGLSQVSNNLPSQAQVAQLTSGLSSLQTEINQLNASVKNPSPQLKQQQTKVSQDAMNLRQALQNLQSSSAAGIEAILQAAMTDASQNGGTVTMNVEQLQSLSSFAKSSGEVAQSSDALLTDLNSLTNLLQEQQTTLANGAKQLNTGVNQLAPNVNRALGGYNALRVANAQLMVGSNTLANGLATAQLGSAQLANGAAVLNANSSALTDGVAQLKVGSNTLATKLSTAAAQVKLQPTGDQTQQQMAQPVVSETTKRGDVPNYGYALAPYVLSLSLFVGALALNIIYPIRKTFSEQENAFRWWLAKGSVVGVAALIQATILILIMVFCLGLVPDHHLQFTAAIYLTSLVYMSIVSLLVIVLDNPGRFLAMVLLVLQLGSSEGTFPIQTAPGFFQAVNPFVPMTYSIRALRESISGGLSTSFYLNSMWVLVVFLLVANVLLLGFFAYRGKRKFTHTSVDGDD